jgi:hypothetical protein
VTDAQARELAEHWVSATWVDEAEATALWDAGAGAHDYAQAADLKRHRVTPRHLGLSLEGSKVIGMVRGGRSVATVVALMRMHGHLD